MKSFYFKSVVIALFLLSCLGLKAEDTYTFTTNNMTFSLISTESVAILEMVVPEDGNVVIPSEITYNNRTFKVSEIGNAYGSLFKNPEKIISLVIPSTIGRIQTTSYFETANQFEECTNLKKITIEDSDNSLSFPPHDDETLESLFSNCPLEEVYIGRNIGYRIRYKASGYDLLMNKYSGSPFKNSKTLKKVEFGDKVTEIKQSCFLNCEELKEVKIPKSVTVIPDCAFAHCTSLSQLVSHDNIQSIGYLAFYDTGISTLVLPESIETIGWGTFRGCKQLKSVTINDKIKIIPREAFDYCSDLLKLTIGKSVEEIDYCAFDKTSIEIIESKIEDPSKCSIKYVSAFPINVYTFATLHVPFGTKDKYLASHIWNQFIDIREDLQTDIKTLKENKSNNNSRFSLNGQRITQPQKGINIIKESDGTTKKVIVTF